MSMDRVKSLKADAIKFVQKAHETNLQINF